MTTEILYAGKYKTVEDLEQGYRQSSAEAIKLKEAEKGLQSQVAEYQVPEDYQIPEEYKAIGDADIAANKAIAKAAGLSQKQFAGLLKGIGETAQSRKTQIEEDVKKRTDEYTAARSKLDPKELEIVESFVTEVLPPELAQHAKQAIVNPEVFGKLKGLRDKMVSNNMPGIGSATPAPTTPQYDEGRLKAAQKAARDNPTDMALREKYLEEIKIKSNYEKTLTNQNDSIIY